MRVLLVGGTGFIGPYVAKELYERGHEVTVFHRGQHESVLLPDVRHFRSEQAAMPVLSFPRALLGNELVIHMIPMGEADMRAAVQTFTGRAARLVALSSGDVYRAYGRFTGLEPGPVEEDLLHEDSPCGKSSILTARRPSPRQRWIIITRKFLSSVRCSDKPSCPELFSGCPKCTALEAM